MIAGRASNAFSKRIEPMAGTLDGFRILDLTRLLPGAVATQWLAEAGAEVIKIEQPGAGDYARTLFSDGESPVFEATNRGKKSVVLDLKSDGGRAAFLALVETADVLIESFRPGVMARLGFSYEQLKTRNPWLIYAAITGYGQDGPHRDLAGHDINYLAIAGVLDLIGVKDGPPCVPGVQIADIAGGSMQAVMSVLMALVARSRTGEGQFIDVSMTGGSARLLAVPLAQYRANRMPVSRGDGVLGGGHACYNVYRCRDARWVAIGALESKFWANLCRALGCEDLIADQFSGEERQAQMRQRLQSIFSEKTASEWFELLGNKDCCVTPVRSIEELEAVESGAPAPRLGEHTTEILKELAANKRK
jgi:crotonobetainyl-CoA:carnitine CoA-transferase CaiB-like acyl-CoA transferase